MRECCTCVCVNNRERERERDGTRLQLRDRVGYSMGVAALVAALGPGSNTRPGIFQTGPNQKERKERKPGSQ